MKFREFNNLTSKEKWKKYKEFKDVAWACYKCRTILSDGIRSAFFPREEICCGNCDSMLTRRTGGGQRDPFNWIAIRDKKQHLKLKVK